MAIKINHIGKRYGECTVIKELEPTPSGSRRVLCRCDCGNEFDSSLTSVLKSKDNKCCNECLIKSRRKDITGQTFGRLEVLKLTDKRNSGGQLLYKCKCNCENNTIIYVPRRRLTSGNTVSCGCYAKEFSYLKKKHNRYDLSGEYGIGYCEDGYEYWFDLEDYDKINQYYWNHDENGYVTTKRKIDGKNKTILMHRLVMNIDNELQVDHIKHNVYDNRKSELRVCTLGENDLNHGIFKNNTSGVTGVSWDSKVDKWAASITYNGHHIWLGYHTDLNEAKEVRKQAENKYFKEYSYDNSMNYIS